MQIHDYNPGYLGGWPDGVFWTMPLHESTMSVSRGNGTARYGVEGLQLSDYTNFANAFANGPTTLGVVSFELRWFDITAAYNYTHRGNPAEPDNYALDYVVTHATLEWTAENDDGFTFTSYPADTPGKESSALFAVVGTERNGVFLHA